MKAFTLLKDAIEFSESIGGVVYQFGGIYKVYGDASPHPIGFVPVWVSRLNEATLINFIDAI